jgi:endonuclease/exonuclease/phosphatase family metal-dependent hydrolase/predicted phosphodiesterase
MNKFNTLFLLGLLLCPVWLMSAEPTYKIAAKEDNSIRIMTYNVHNFVGMDNELDYQRIADVINEAAPDVVAIQEADSVTQRSQGAYTLRELADRTLMFPTYGAAIDFQGGKYGVGLLSKEKPLTVRQIPLPGREESRTLLIAEFKKYVVASTHFSLTPEDRLASVALIREAMKDINKPAFLAGDMNCVPSSNEQTAIKELFTTLNDTAKYTFPSDNSNRCIDYIYGYNNGNVYTILNRQVIDEKLASDHLPLFVDVRLKANAGEIFRTKPYLQNPVGNGITVTWFTNVPTHGWVEYGVNPAELTKKELIVDGQIICNTKQHKIRLTDLRPGVKYYYRVCSQEITLYQAYKKEFGDTAYSDLYSFTLPDADIHDFTAIIFNDIHKQNQVLDKLYEQVENQPYNFVIFNGDCIDDPKNETEAIEFLTRMNEKVHAETVPVLYLRGNHEIRNAYSIQIRALFDYIGDKTYSAFNWGDTRFVFLDCGEDKPDSTWVYYNLNDFTGLRNEQVGFLKSELSGKEFQIATKRVLVHHIPIYGMGERAYNPCLALWGDLLSKAPFDICINGHTHRHAYHPKGSVGNNYPVIIGGGNRVETATVMILQKQGKSLTLKVLNAKGEVLDDLKL